MVGKTGFTLGSAAGFTLGSAAPSVPAPDHFTARCEDMLERLDALHDRLTRVGNALHGPRPEEGETEPEPSSSLDGFLSSIAMAISRCEVQAERVGNRLL